MDARRREIGTRCTEVEQRSRRGSRSWWWIGGALLLAACGASGREDGEGRVIVPSEAVHVVGTSEVIARVADLQPTADGRVWILNATSPLFVVLGPDGRVERAGLFSQWENQSANVFPEYADLRCTPDGTLWLQPFDIVTGGMGRGPNWHRISPDGSRTLVTLPEPFMPIRFEADRIWGTVQDSLGVASVAWIAVDALR